MSQSKPADLSVNLNKIALIRNSRDTTYPSVTHHAQICIDAGADGITVHPRPDQRHIRVDDCYDLATMLSVEFNIEGNPFAPAMKSDRPGVSDYPGFIDLVKDIKPAQCTLVPDSNEQLTSDHGFDLTQSGDQLAPIIQELQKLGVRVSLFMDPDLQQIELAKQVGADRIELYTGPYADAIKTNNNADAVFEQFYRAGEKAQDINIGLNAGHDLNLDNLSRFATIPQLLEVSIGHAMTVDAISMGLANAVKAYQRCLGKT
ncbi:pyridoxine 5'-phosphate synthase [Oceanicoccus sagamiensis]|uniref:Pyridoxine 5'-phosphate synthase n=1 Tax=Oceanicoccus sagamiensis TaxID=716816 RepID=A0A1X9NF05_9GAMM|nr:pyridoxine 5'-phosphate synthase [Oceanicoccus sagamiensis]ARN75022.1 pyridoxine 5'-phosphate synthase [Oceanicoccus sagamiensis]